MSVRAAKLRRYAAGLLRAVRHWRPLTLLTALGETPLTIKHLDRYGFDLLLDVRDPAISRPLLLSGDYEPHVASALGAVLRPDTRLLDLGANIGFFSLLAATRCPHGRVFSLEPDPNNFRLLSASIALNGLDDRITASHVHGPQPHFCEVRTVRLDELLAQETVDVIKLDIEGHEPLALRGAEGLLRRCRPVILMEFSPGNIINIARTRPKDLLTFLRDLGYRWQVIGTGGQLDAPGDDAAALLRELQRSGRHHADLLLTPQ
ncbi:MAG: FkbM family methyltransferase [Kiritimatiellaeota bacterium]|nr:FkbM family methyltransferase [Kiritimatiellota bacterium]